MSITTLTGLGHVTVYRLLHRWPREYALLTYTTMGDFGDAAVVGSIPVPGDDGGPSLLDVAAHHEAMRMYGAHAGHADAAWVICSGWSARIVPQHRQLELHAAAWELERDRTIELRQTMYGHDLLHTGRLTLDDPELMAQAVGVLAAA